MPFRTTVPFDPTRQDGKATNGLAVPKSNWAIRIDEPPFRAYPVTCGITFTFGGVEVNRNAQVMSTIDQPIKGLFASGDIVGLFFHNYPSFTGQTRNAVFGRLAGKPRSRRTDRFNCRRWRGGTRTSSPRNPPLPPAPLPSRAFDFEIHGRHRRSDGRCVQTPWRVSSASMRSTCSGDGFLSRLPKKPMTGMRMSRNVSNGVLPSSPHATCTPPP